MAGLRDHQPVSRAHDARGFPQDRLELSQVRSRPGKLARSLTRVDPIEAHDPALELGDDLLCDDDDITVPQLESGGDHRFEVVPLFDLRKPIDREDLDHGCGLSGGAERDPRDLSALELEPK